MYHAHIASISVVVDDTAATTAAAAVPIAVDAAQSL